MHWAREHVNPMVALRDLLRSERWDEDRPQIAARVRKEHWQERQQREGARRIESQALAVFSSGAIGNLPPHPEQTSPTPLKRTAVTLKAPPRTKLPQP